VGAMILYLLDWHAMTGAEIYDIINNADFSTTFGPLRERIHNFLLVCGWMKGELASTPAEKKCQRLLYADLSKAALSFVRSKVCDYITGEHIHFEDMAESLLQQIEVPDLLADRMVHLRQDPCANGLFLRFYLDYDFDAGADLCYDYFNNESWDPATSAATYCIEWRPDQLRELVLLLIRRAQNEYNKENSPTTTNAAY
jgi:hypothetical protein